MYVFQRYDITKISNFISNFNLRNPTLLQILINVQRYLFPQFTVEDDFLRSVRFRQFESFQILIFVKRETERSADRNGDPRRREETVYAARPRKYGGQCCAEIQANASLRRAAAPSSLNLLNDTLLSEHQLRKASRARP